MTSGSTRAICAAMASAGAIVRNEKIFYFTVLMYGLFSAVSLQKSVRDRLEGFPVTDIYYSLCWVSLGLNFILLTAGLWNARLSGSQKGFYSMAFALSLFAAVVVQKNVRDLAAAGRPGNLLQTE